MRALTLVVCEPYGARLTEHSCVDRWRKAQGVSRTGKGVGAGNAAVSNAARRGALALCIECEVGRARVENLERGNEGGTDGV